MHAACYAHALVPSSLDEAQDSLDAFNKGEKGADACLEDLSETAAMVRSNVHADHSMLYSKTMIPLTLAAPPFIHHAVDIRGDALLLMSLLFGAFVFFSRSTFELRRSEVDQGGAVDLSRNPNRL